MATILHCGDDPSTAAMIGDALDRAGHEPIRATNVIDAMRLVARGGIDLIVADHQLAGLTGLEFLGRLAREAPTIPVIMLTGFERGDQSNAFIGAGAVACVTKPVRAPQLELAVEQALERARLRRDNAALRAELSALRDAREIVGESTAMRATRRLLAMIAPSRAAVDIRGERGTGKTLIARAIHRRSDRCDAPLIEVDAAALSDIGDVIARSQRGTLLIDHADRLSDAVHDELRHATGPSGHWDVRIIVVTDDVSGAGEVDRPVPRELLAELTAMPLVVPPLRARTDDIAALSLYFAAQTATALGKPFRGFTSGALAFLEHRDWAGNVCELEQMVSRAVLVADDAAIPLAAFDGGVDQTTDIILRSLNVADAERALIARALVATGGNRTQAAKLLGMSDRTLRNKLTPRP
jgi:DNA-binding NtrC family response regulator